MPERWLQIKGDPSVRAFLFQQQRVESRFDQQIDCVLDTMFRLLVTKGAFHVKAHFSSSQLTCWFHADPYNYQVFVGDDVLAADFLDRFADHDIEHLGPRVAVDDLAPVLAEFRRLRLTDRQVYLRNASINRVNGLIGMTFSCDGSHYIDFRDFLNRLDCFGSGP